jgi:hypothetical protein
MEERVATHLKTLVWMEEEEDGPQAQVLGDRDKWLP